MKWMVLLIAFLGACQAMAFSNRPMCKGDSIWKAFRGEFKSIDVYENEKKVDMTLQTEETFATLVVEKHPMSPMTFKGKAWTCTKEGVLYLVIKENYYLNGENVDFHQSYPVMAGGSHLAVIRISKGTYKDKKHIVMLKKVR